MHVQCNRCGNHSLCTRKRDEKQIPGPMYKFKSRGRSPVHGPSIVRKEFLTSSLQSIIVPQIMNTDRSPSQRIDARLLNILSDAQSIETDP